MKKFAVILVVLSLTRIGVAYADTTNPSTNQNYFFGTKAAAANLNQVLALLVGPEGKPGPAGVAGKDGLCSRYAAGNKIELTDILGGLCQKNPQFKEVLKEASN